MSSNPPPQHAPRGPPTNNPRGRPNHYRPPRHRHRSPIRHGLRHAAAPTAPDATSDPSLSRDNITEAVPGPANSLNSEGAAGAPFEPRGYDLYLTTGPPDVRRRRSKGDSRSGRRDTASDFSAFPSTAALASTPLRHSVDERAPPSRPSSESSSESVTPTASSTTVPTIRQLSRTASHTNVLLPNHVLQPARPRHAMRPVMQHPHLGVGQSRLKTNATTTTSQPVKIDQAPPPQVTVLPVLYSSSSSSSDGVDVQPAFANSKTHLSRLDTRAHAMTDPSPSPRDQPDVTDRTSTTSWPNLLDIKPIPPMVIARDRADPCPPGELPQTKKFSLHKPDWADSPAPLPEPYNPAYPHPLTAYASPGVNPHTVLESGYHIVLEEMLKYNPDRVKGSILASSDRNVSAPALMIPREPGEGLGIPERLWGRFESLGAARLPVGVNGVSPFAPRFVATPGLGGIDPMTDILSPVGSHPRGEDVATYLAAHSLRHAASASQLSSIGAPRPPLLRRHSAELEAFSALLPPPIVQPMQGSKFHKTELCPWFGEAGVCKYGADCQFAHGLAELRSPEQVQLPSSQYGASSPLSRAVIPPTTGVFVEPRITPGNRPEPRRASLPPRQLDPVEEAEDDHDPIHIPSLFSPKPAHPPIGAERAESSVNPSVPRLVPTRSFLSPFGLITPPLNSTQLHDSLYDEDPRVDMPWLDQLRLAHTPRPLDGSLSTSASSGRGVATPPVSCSQFSLPDTPPQTTGFSASAGPTFSAPHREFTFVPGSSGTIRHMPGRHESFAAGGIPWTRVEVNAGNPISPMAGHAAGVARYSDQGWDSCESIWR